jgi:hypothetical protein
MASLPRYVSIFYILIIHFIGEEVLEEEGVHFSLTGDNNFYKLASRRNHYLLVSRRM